MNKKNIEELEKSIIIDHPFVADDDKILLLAVWKQQGLELTPDQKTIFLSDCSSAESITRVRRKLIEMGIISSSPEAVKRRAAQAEAFRKRYSRQKQLL
jgi:hypothetical protein